MKIKDLAVKHDYYANNSNYYSNECTWVYDTWKDFYSEWGEADIDMNLIYRWDVSYINKEDQYYMDVFIIGQRKGIYSSCTIEHVFDEDVDSIIEFLNKHWNKLNNIWTPISKK